MEIVYSFFIGIIVGMIVGKIVGIGLQCRRDRSALWIVRARLAELL
jgi:Na+/H+ antiporter NhaA